MSSSRPVVCHPLMCLTKYCAAMVRIGQCHRYSEYDRAPNHCIGRSDKDRSTNVLLSVQPAAIRSAALTTGHAITAPGYGVDEFSSSALLAIPANPHDASTSAAQRGFSFRLMAGPSTAMSAPRPSSQARVKGEKYAQVGSDPV